MNLLARTSYDEAYPGLSLRPRTRNWWARLVGQPAECVHLAQESKWSASLLPDALYLRGRRQLLREPARPEVSLCRDCLEAVLVPELKQYDGRVVAFEPDRGNCSQYFFVAEGDFAASGLRPEVSQAIQSRLEERAGECDACGGAATWLWLPQDQVASLDDVEAIAKAGGERLCARHGAARLAASFQAMGEANLLYVNAPYGEAGAYLWI